MRHFHESKLSITFDLHVLSTPPAFVLSQDQTLQFYILNTFSSVHSLLTYFFKSSVRLLFSFQRPAFYSCPPFRAEGEDNKSSSRSQTFLSLFVTFPLDRCDHLPLMGSAQQVRFIRESPPDCQELFSLFQTKCPSGVEPKGHFSINFGGDLLSHTASHAVSSAR